MIFRIPDNLNPAAAGNHRIPLRHSFPSVVSAFGMDVRTQETDQLTDVRRIEDGHRIHILQRGQYLSAFAGRSAWAAFALQGANTGIRIYGHDYAAAQLLGAVQVAYMANVQQIKAAIGKNDFVSGIAPALDAFDELGLGDNFLRDVNRMLLVANRIWPFSLS